MQAIYELSGFHSSSGSSSVDSWYGLNATMYADSSGPALKDCTIHGASVVFPYCSNHEGIILRITRGGVLMTTGELPGREDTSLSASLSGANLAAFAQATGEVAIQIFVHNNNQDKFFKTRQDHAQLVVNYTPNTSRLTLSAASVEAGGTVTANIGAYDAAFSHQVVLEFGTKAQTWDVAAGVTAQAVDVPVGWLDQIPTAQSGPARVTLITYSAGVYVGAVAASLTVTVPASAAPTFSASCAPLLTVGGTTYPSMGSGVYVQGKSGCTARITGAAAQYGATVTGYNIRGGGYSGTSATLQTGLLGGSGTVPFVFRVTDSRGMYTEKTVNLTVLAYTPPQVSSLTGWRVDSAGAAAPAGTLGKCRAVWSYTSLGGANTCAVKAFVKPAGGSETALNAAMASGVDYWVATAAGNMTLAVTTRYVLRLALTDKYGTVSVTADLPSAAFAMHLNAAGNSIAFGKACERSNAVEIAAGRTLYLGDSTLRDWIRNTFFPVGAIYQSYAAASPASLFGGTWAQIQNRFLVGVGSSYAAGATGGEATHKLTVNELPSHSHNYSYPGYEAGGEWYGASGTAKGNTVATTAVGGGAAHENRPPYFAVYIWRRTA